MKKNDLNEFPLTTKVIFYVHRLTSTMRNKRSCCDCVYFFFLSQMLSDMYESCMSAFFCVLKTGEVKRIFLAVFYFFRKKSGEKRLKIIKMTTTVKKSTHVYLFFSSSVFCLVINVSYLLCTKCMQEMVSSLSTKYCY